MLSSSDTNDNTTSWRTLRVSERDQAHLLTVYRLSWTTGVCVRMSQKSERFREIRAIGRGRFGHALLVEDRAEGDRPLVIKVPIDKSTGLALINQLLNTAILFTILRNVSHPDT